MINVYDNFFSEEIREEIWNLLIRPKWTPLGGGNSINSTWHMNGLEKESYFNDYLYKMICDKLERKYQVKRIYANGQTAGQSGNPHYDDGDFTFLYYPNPKWEINWNGHLIFSEDGEEFTRIIEYKPNRAILFPAKMLHYADAPHSYFNGFRVSLAYKFMVIGSYVHLKKAPENID